MHLYFERNKVVDEFYFELQSKLMTVVFFIDVLFPFYQKIEKESIASARQHSARNNTNTTQE